MLKGDIGVLGSHPFKVLSTGQDEAVPFEDSPLKTNHEADTIVTVQAM